MYKVIGVFLLVFIINLNGVMMKEGEFVKQEQELNSLKQELDEFYKNKEKEYKKHKNELLLLDKQIQGKLDEVEKTKKANEKILKEIKLEITSKAMTLYGKMKIKVVKNILQEKLDNKEFNEVFDIIIRLKDKRVMELLKKFDTKTSTKLMNKLKNYKKNKGKNNG